jgi:catechol 2,3-dioxygenase-like lactoylglutathione lyase family enzyme
MLRKLPRQRTEEVHDMSPVSVRYIADDVESATAFYRDNLGFTVQMSPAPGFAILTRGELRLLLNAPGIGGAGQATPDGRLPQPGGWNRIQLEVDDLASEVEALRNAGAHFRSASSPAGAAGRSCSTTRPATRSRSSNSTDRAIPASLSQVAKPTKPARRPAKRR